MLRRVVFFTLFGTLIVQNAPAFAQDKIGIAECDEYLTKVQTCVASLSAAQGQSMSAMMEQMRTAWQSAAQTPQGKAGLAAGCKQASDMAKPQFTAAGCKW